VVGLDKRCGAPRISSKQHLAPRRRFSPRERSSSPRFFARPGIAGTAPPVYRPQPSMVRMQAKMVHTAQSQNAVARPLLYPQTPTGNVGTRTSASAAPSSVNGPRHLFTPPAQAWNNRAVQRSVSVGGQAYSPEALNQHLWDESHKQDASLVWHDEYRDAVADFAKESKVFNTEIDLIMGLASASMARRAALRAPLRQEAPVAAVPVPATPIVPAPVVPGVVKAAILLNPPFKGTTAGQRYIRWGKNDYPHTSISFKLERKGEVARITGLHASMGQSDTHLWWNHQSPSGTFHLSSQSGAKYDQVDVHQFSSSGRELLQRAWLKVKEHAEKVNCTAAKPPGID
jgi:hypothetical protein